MTSTSKMDNTMPIIKQDKELFDLASSTQVLELQHNIDLQAKDISTLDKRVSTLDENVKHIITPDHYLKLTSLYLLFLKLGFIFMVKYLYHIYIYHLISFMGL